jgi:hypothetical protein
MAAAARRPWRGTALALAAVLYAAPELFAQRPAEEAIAPLAEYKAVESRVLAQAYLPELRLLYEAVRRCAPELDFHRHGLGFRRPFGSEHIEPYLAIWVWLPREPAPEGADVGARAADAFHRYGPRLLPALAGRARIHADTRVGGYGLVLTWLKPSAAVPPIGETLVVFVPKSAVEPFVGRTAPVTAMLGQALIRAFDGQTEVMLPHLAIREEEMSAPC